MTDLHKPMFLTTDELIQLTDCHTKQRMRDFLSKNGIKFLIGATGWPKVLRDHIYEVMGNDMNKVRKNKPNFSNSKYC